MMLIALVLDFASGDRLGYADEKDYAALATSILHDHRFSYPDYHGGEPIVSRPPGYPAVIAAIYSVAERPLAAKIVNTVFLLLATLALASLATRMVPGAGALMPWLVLASPLLIYCSSLLYPQTLSCLLLTLTLLLIGGREVSFGQAALAGICYGVLILAVPYFQALLPVLLAYMVIWAGGRRRAAALRAGVFALICVLVVLPWSWRNYREFGAIVPVSANNGFNLFVGNSPITTANSGLTVNVLPLCNRLRPHMSETDFDKALQGCALDWIEAHPLDAARLYVAKLVNYFNFRNEVASAGPGGAWRDWIVFLSYYPLLALALWRAALWRRHPLERHEILVLGLYFLNAFASAIFFTRLRFRIPFDFVLLAVAGAFLHTLWCSRPRSGSGCE